MLLLSLIIKHRYRLSGPPRVSESPSSRIELAYSFSASVLYSLIFSGPPSIRYLKSHKKYLYHPFGLSPFLASRYSSIVFRQYHEQFPNSNTSDVLLRLAHLFHFHCFLIFRTETRFFVIVRF